MSSRTAIINRSCIRAGVNIIASPDEDTEQARKTKAVFDQLARAELRKQAWSFSKKRATLAALADAPLFDFNTAYDLPSDCLRVISVNGNWVFNSIREGTPDSDSYYTIEGRTILLKDTGALQLVYVGDFSMSPALWDSAFEDAFVLRLAGEIVPSLTKNLALKQDIRNDYKDAIMEARRTNAIELPPQPIPDDSWVLSRYW